MARKIRTPNADSSSPVDAIHPGPIKAYTIGTDPLAFPPEADFPRGGRFFVRCSGQVQLRTEEGGDSYLLDEGHWTLSADGPGEYFLSAGSDVGIRVMQHKEAATVSAHAVTP